MLLSERLLLVCSASIVAARCGVDFGEVSCPNGECCSEAGWCGTTAEYCMSPQCQYDYSDNCENFDRPAGSDTLSIPRPKIGNVPYGSIIYDCTIPGTFGLTFDDGPWVYTSQLLDILDSYGVKATFMVTGNNLGKGAIDNESLPWAAIMRRMYNSGHQIGSHTWGHQDLTQVPANMLQTEIMYNEMAFRNLFGWIPTYFRVPYLAYDSRSLRLLNTMGYHVIDVNLDTKDYMYDDPTLIQASKDKFSRLVSPDFNSHSYIELSHDIHEQTVVNLTAYMITTLRARGYRPVPVGECLGDPPANWYRDAGGTSSTRSSAATSSTSSAQSSLRSASRSLSTSATSTLRTGTSSTTTTTRTTTTTSAAATPTNKASTSGMCGGMTGFTCTGSTFGSCCSFYGYCGSTSAHCGTGCQSDFGKNCTVITKITTTTNGVCGKAYLSTCLGYGTKNCCSSSGYCGNTSAYCGTGCQLAYGTCT